MIIHVELIILSQWLETELYRNEKPYWGSSDRLLTLKLARPDVSSKGIVVFRLNKIAIDVKREDGVCRFIVDPLVDSPAIVFKVFSHQAGTKLHVINHYKQLDTYVNGLINTIKERFEQSVMLSHEGIIINQ